MSLSIVVLMYGCSGSVSTFSNNAIISSLLVYPRALRSILTGVFRFLSTLTETTSLLLVSNSIQAPRWGISLAEAKIRPEDGSLFTVKYAPGDLTN